MRKKAAGFRGPIERTAETTRKASIGTSDLGIENELYLLNLIRECRQISRAELAKLTELQPSTITMIVKRLLKSQMVTEGAMGPSTGGRRPSYLAINAKKMFVLGIDIAVNTTTYIVSDFSGHPVFMDSVPTESKPEFFLPSLCTTVKNKLRAAKLGTRVSAVGVSLPGMLDVATGSLAIGESLGWENVPIRALVQKSFHLPTFIENDTNSAALGEIWLGSSKLRDLQRILYVLVVDGIGVALILDGKLYRGSHLGTPGFGHMMMDPNGPFCTCGGRGCWETLASDRALIKNYQALTSATRKEKDAEAIVDAAVCGDSLASQALATTANSLGQGLLSLVHGLAPQTIILGGSMTRAWDLIFPVIQRVIHSRMVHPGLSTVTLQPSSVPYPQSALGSVAVVLSGILETEFGRPVLTA